MYDLFSRGTCHCFCFKMKVNGVSRFSVVNAFMSFKIEAF